MGAQQSTDGSGPMVIDLPHLDLHPDRIRAVMVELYRGVAIEGMSRELTLEETRTCLAAVSLIRRCQLSWRVTSTDAEAGHLFVRFLRVLK